MPAPRAGLRPTYRRPFLHGVRAQDRLQQYHADSVRRAESIRGARRQQRLMTAAQSHETHIAAHWGTRETHGALDAGRHDGAREIELDELDLDAAVHDDRELVVRGREPVGRALRAQRLDDVLAVLRDDDLLVRRGARGDLEHVRERVALDVVVDDLDVALDVARQRAERRRELADAAALESHLLSPLVA